MKRILATSDVRVKGHRCVIIDPGNQDVSLKMHWLLFNVPDVDIRAALLPYGKVTDVTKERWRAEGVADKGSTTPSVALKLNPGSTVDDIPHRMRVAGGTVLLVVPAKPPLCLRCDGIGHVWRDCRVPHCSQCHGFGREQAGCIRTYASVAGPLGRSEISEYLIDEADREETAGVVAEEPMAEASASEVCVSQGGAVLDSSASTEDAASTAGSV